MTTDVHMPHGAPPRTASAAPSAAPMRPTERLAGLDGLRALAVLAVIAFHLHASWLPGGFLGVDVFFVISGFLITTLLIREERRTRRIDLRSFWTRRARRLLPALLACVAVSTLLAALVERDLLVGVARQTFGALTFTSNWAEIAAGSDYFHATTPQLFMNLWSLAVEEQFYLVWPIVTLVLLREVPSVRVRVAVPLAIGGGSALLMAVLLDPAAPTRVYYGTDTHLVGLMVGAALAAAYAAPHRAWTLTRSWLRLRRYLVGAAGLTLVVLAFRLDESTPFTFRGGFVLAGVATGVLILASVSGAGPLRTFLDGPILRWVGERSYGIYLWHWPIILVVNQMWDTVPGTTSFVTSRGVAFALTLAVAEASYRWVETPVRRHGFRATARAVLVWSRGLARPATRIVGATAALALSAWVLALGTAPTQTSTERLLRTNAAALSAATAPPGSPSDQQPEGQGVGSAPSATSSPTRTAGPGDSPVPRTDERPAASASPRTLARGARQAAFTMPTGDEIDVFGDSMVIGSIPALRYWFPGVRIDARSNTRWSHGLAEVKARGAALRRAVVLGYGTNAGVDRATVEQVLATAGPARMIVLVTEHGPFSRIEPDNAILREIADRHPNVALADWDAALHGTRGQLQPDGIHPSLTGQHLWARTVWGAFAGLVTEHTGVRVEEPHKPVP